MKDKIKKRMDAHIESLIRKETLTKEDYDTLAAALGKIEFDEGKEERNEAFKNSMLGLCTMGLNH